MTSERCKLDFEPFARASFARTSSGLASFEREPFGELPGLLAGTLEGMLVGRPSAEVEERWSLVQLLLRLLKKSEFGFFSSRPDMKNISSS